MKDLLAYLVNNIVENPEAVRIDEAERDGETFFEIRVAQSDMGRLIGRAGRTAKDLRVLVRALAAKEGKRVSVDIIDAGAAA
ncbi:MAG: KH domain-containing protein [Oscillospiraceae bacterium]|jgi:predicted RNA-binding protein YlqC (UPF0109 family)|nr:KH domain-containing protein [Oscillospiraceae bacterium]